MATDLKIGDRVKIKDGSWAVCVSKEWDLGAQEAIKFIKENAR